jgi:hypothetical protein
LLAERILMNPPSSSIASTAGRAATGVLMLTRRSASSTGLMMLKNELERMLEHCPGGKVRDCRVIEALSDPSQRAVSSHLPV